MACRQEKFGTKVLTKPQPLDEEGRAWIQNTRHPAQTAYCENQARTSALQLHREVYPEKAEQLTAAEHAKTFFQVGVGKDCTSRATVQQRTGNEDPNNEGVAEGRSGGLEASRAIENATAKKSNRKFWLPAGAAKHSQRHFIVDSGASFHLVRRQDLTRQELKLYDELTQFNLSKQLMVTLSRATLLMCMSRCWMSPSLLLSLKTLRM